MTPFKTVCDRLSSNQRITVESNSLDIPERYSVSVKALIEIMKPKLTVLDKISIQFIEDAFTDIEAVTKKLDADTENGDIPDSILNVFSSELYGKTINELTDDEQNIIKVLSTYICIQN